jgi:hypothetical protein
LNIEEHVYCTHCKYFSLSDDLVPQCPCDEAEICDIDDCEDSRPLSMRPMYSERLDKMEV